MVHSGSDAVRRVADGLVRRVPGLLDDHGVPGMAIAVCDSESVLWSAGFGTTRVGDGDPVDGETMFGVQSCSKMYTATAVLLAVQEGLVELDVPITRYLPEFRVNSAFEEHPERRITLLHLLSHTAGFTHEAPVGSNYLVGKESFRAHCESISTTWLRFPVGHHYEYSNLGIDLAGSILQRISGQPFHEFVRRVLLEPLGLRRTTFSPREITRAPNRAIGHAASSSRVPLRVPMVAAGGLYTSANDACRYIQLHLSGGASLVDPALLAQMYGVPGAHHRDQGYGLGLGLARAGDVPVRGHGGGGFGFLSDIYWAPHAEVGVVVLTNSTNHPLQWQLVAEILKDLIPTHPQQRKRTKKAATVPATSMAAMAGEYVGGNESLTFALNGNQPTLIRGGTQYAVEFTAPHEFRAEHEQFRFRDLSDGRPAYLENTTDGFTRYRNDIPGPNPSSPDGPWNRTYTVRANGIPLATTKLRKEDDVHLLDHWSNKTLRLQKHAPGIYLSSTGEVLNLTQSPPTYANIKLHPH
ncbi:serine hydrolase domain-containing protein [Kribbella sp. NPDC055071]